jgi:hypothetical protein
MGVVVNNSHSDGDTYYTYNYYSAASLPGSSPPD